MKSILYLLILCVWAISGKAQTAEQKYESYVRDTICHGKASNNCLRKTDYWATRSDGTKEKISGVYEWVGEDPLNNLFKPHFLMKYMRLLRDAYYSNPTYRDQLYNQIDFIVSKAVNRNGALVWENTEGIAQGMEQVEFADYFVTAASAFKYNNDIKTATGIMTYALRFFRSVDIQAGVHTGGVSSIPTDCGANKARARPCYWFHSRGIAITGAPGPRTVLNQHLHVISNLIAGYINVTKSADLVDSSQFGSSQKVLDFLQDKAIGGLYQLAFSGGHKKVAPNRPPNIRQFMNLRRVPVHPTPGHPDGNPLRYYWAYYEYDMSKGKGLNISNSNTCHYHTHVLELVAGIQNMLDQNGSIFKKKENKNGWRLYEVMDALLEGKGEATGMEGSKNAVYQFYRSEGPAYKARRQKCEKNEPLSPEAITLYSSRYDYQERN